MSKRKTLLDNEIRFVAENEVVDDAAEKRRRASGKFDNSIRSNIRNQVARLNQENDLTNRTSVANKSRMTGSVSAQSPLVLPPPDQAKPSNEELSKLYNSCVKLLNENKINVKNAFQLKLIDYMSDILLSKDIVGGETNFQVVGCTIDVGTKIYAARVDALHKNTYQVLSGLGHAGNEEEGGDAEATENNGEGAEQTMANLDNLDDEEEATTKKTKAKKRRNKKSSQIVENLDTITAKIVDDFKDEDLYFAKISTCTEHEGIAGILLNKLHANNDLNRILINGDDCMYPEEDLKEDHKNTKKSVEVDLMVLVESGKNNLDFTNLKICPDLDSFRFIGWNCESNDEISRLIIERNNQRDPDELEAHRFDANNLQGSILNSSEINAPFTGPADNDVDIENGLENDDNYEVGGDLVDQASNAGMGVFEKIDDLRSLNSLADLTTLVSNSVSDYSYFDFDKLKVTDLPRHLKRIALKLGGAEIGQKAQKVLAAAKNRKESAKISFGVRFDKTKFIKITKKAIYIADRTIEKRSEKPTRLESERQLTLAPRNLLRPYSKKITAKILNDIEMVDNLLLNEEEETRRKGVEGERASVGAGNKEGNWLQQANDDDDNHNHGPDGDFEIPCTAQTNEPFFTQNGGEFSQSQQIDRPLGELPGAHFNEMDKFDGDNLVQAPMQVNVLNIQYAKTSKNIDVRRLKQTIWSLLSAQNDKVRYSPVLCTVNPLLKSYVTKKKIKKLNTQQENADAPIEPGSINASLKAIYRKLKPPIVSQKVYDDLSICIVFQMVLFLANEHNLMLKNDLVGSDLIITNC